MNGYIQVEKTSLRGYKYTVLEKVMPRVPDSFLNTSIYIYPSEEEARNGGKSGGSGFVLVRKCPLHKTDGFAYAVTNRHVINDFINNNCNECFLRVNLVSGGFDILPVSIDSWVLDNDGDDLAICYLQHSNNEFDIKAVSESMIITEEIVDSANVGIGDEVFLVGRFKEKEGKETNTPTARFGTIAMMPNEPVWHEEFGTEQICYLTETRTVTGYSGSPVFLYIPSKTPRFDGDIGSEGRTLKEPILGLLGVHWGHLKEKIPVLEDKPKTREKRVKTGKYIEMNSGMGMTVPAWKIQELLERPELKKPIDDHLAEHAQKSAGTCVELD